jgi:crotonobetainyl-CoA:carnitine CoA-transferase CaiB-like acyl-CoA transferase
VVVQNMRPGALDQLGLSYAQVRDINPGIIYASLSGFGGYGPRAGLAGVNIVAQAASGLSGTTMYGGRPPGPLGTALCDIVAAIWCSTAILAALRERDRTGWGQYIDASLFEAGISLMMSPIAMQMFATDAAKRMGRVDGNAPSGWFETSDERYIAIFASYPATWLRFIKALGMQELAADPRFAERGTRTQHSSELHAIVAEKLRTRSADEWLDVLKQADVPAALVSTVGEVIEDPQVIVRHLVQTVDHPSAGQVPLVRLPLFLSTSAVPPLSRPPLLGEHTDDILTALGRADDAEELRSSGVV